MVNELFHKAHQQVHYFYLKESNVKAHKNAQDIFVNFFSSIALERKKEKFFAGIHSIGYSSKW